MPRHDPAKTPPERRRAKKGTITSAFSGGRHTLQSLSALAGVQNRWGTGYAETIRRSLLHAFKCPLSPREPETRRITDGHVCLHDRIAALLHDPPEALDEALNLYAEAQQTAGRRHTINSTHRVALHGLLLRVGAELAKALEGA